MDLAIKILFVIFGLLIIQLSSALATAIGISRSTRFSIIKSMFLMIVGAIFGLILIAIGWLI